MVEYSSNLPLWRRASLELPLKTQNFLFLKIEKIKTPSWRYLDVNKTAESLEPPAQAAVQGRVPDGVQSHRSRRTEQMALLVNPNYACVTIRVDA